MQSQVAIRVVYLLASPVVNQADYLLEYPHSNQVANQPVFLLTNQVDNLLRCRVPSQVVYQQANQV